MSDFALDITRYVEAANGQIDLVVRKICLELFSRVIMMSPVATGRFRGNWQVGIGAIPTGTLALNDKTGTATISKVDAKVAGVKAGDIVYLANNLPYARRLEYGYSKQAPNGMVRTALRMFSGVIAVSPGTSWTMQNLRRR